MARYATSWSYSAEVVGLGLSASEFAVLRAICWRIEPRFRRTRPLSTERLMQLTAIKSRQTISRALQSLKARGLIDFQHACALSPDERAAFARPRKNARHPDEPYKVNPQPLVYTFTIAKESPE